MRDKVIAGLAVLPAVLGIALAVTMGTARIQNREQELLDRLTAIEAAVGKCADRFQMNLILEERVEACEQGLTVMDEELESCLRGQVWDTETEKP